MSLWTANDAQLATGGKCNHNWIANGISIDSRTISKGDLFIALTDQRDGHQFVAAAFKAGAAAAMVSRIPEDISPNMPLLIVSNVMDGLQKLAIWRRWQINGKVIAITGSVGKTSTKEMLRVILSDQGCTFAARKSFNNHWGVPITLASMPVGIDFAVVEVGMSNPGEIELLSKLVRPHIGLITEIAPAHLATFNSLEDIAVEKASLFNALEQEKIAIVHSRSACVEILEQRAQFNKAKIRYFGDKNGDHLRLLSAHSVDSGTVMKIERDSMQYCVMLNCFGNHFVRNALGALTAAEAAGADPNVAALDLRQWQPPKGRGECVVVVLHPDLPPLNLIDDAFNANPVSVAAAFEGLAARKVADTKNTTDRIIVFLGDMLELGPNEVMMHEAIAELPFVDKVSTIHCSGSLMKKLYDKLNPVMRGEWCETAEEMKCLVKELVAPGDLVLVKGSKGSRISTVADAIRSMNHAVK